MKRYLSLARCKGLLALVALVGAANLFAANPANPVSPKPKAVTYDSLVISRHPACPNGPYTSPYALTGITFSSAGKFGKVAECLDRDSSYTLPYELFFYNEFAYHNCDPGDDQAFPFMISNGARSSVAFVGIGWDVFLNYTFSPEQTMQEQNIDFFATDEYRCKNLATKLLNFDLADEFLKTENIAIGRNIQTTDPDTPNLQNVYLLYVSSYRSNFLFMVKSFKNSDVPQHMTLVLRKL